MCRIVMAAVLVALGTTTLPGQTASTRPQFAVASIKPSDSTDPRRYISGMQRGSFKAVNYTLKDLIRFGWNVRAYQVFGGPKWLDSDRYNIEVKPESPFDVPGRDNEGDRTIRLMVQSMLNDRFKLKVHRETKETRVYFLEVAKNGPLMKGSVEPADQGPHVQDAKGQTDSA
jgi:uncharacterized protein (TIGR03435 family)